MSESKTISDLRETLFATLEAVKSGAMDLDKAKAINEVAKTIVDSARVEVDYLRTTGGGESSFVDTAVGTANLPQGITGVTRHRLKG
jgi:hypothetical protein